MSAVAIVALLTIALVMDEETTISVPINAFAAAKLLVFTVLTFNIST
jgi:hypothetical protein